MEEGKGGPEGAHQGGGPHGPTQVTEGPGGPLRRGEGRGPKGASGATRSTKEGTKSHASTTVSYMADHQKHNITLKVRKEGWRLNPSCPTSSKEGTGDEAQDATSGQGGRSMGMRRRGGAHHHPLRAAGRRMEAEAIHPQKAAGRRVEAEAFAI